jgi:hypothetical protein
MLRGACGGEGMSEKPKCPFCEGEIKIINLVTDVYIKCPCRLIDVRQELPSFTSNDPSAIHDPVIRRIIDALNTRPIEQELREEIKNLLMDKRNLRKELDDSLREMGAEIEKLYGYRDCALPLNDRIRELEEDNERMKSLLSRIDKWFLAGLEENEPFKIDVPDEPEWYREFCWEVSE